MDKIVLIVNMSQTAFRVINDIKDIRYLFLVSHLMSLNVIYRDREIFSEKTQFVFYIQLDLNQEPINLREHESNDVCNLS